jgi:hypothetical protein
MRKFLCVAAAVATLSISLDAQVVIDHRCVDPSKLPASFVEKAKAKFKVAYGHTSHGSQLVSGMEAMAAADPLYKFGRNAAPGSLSLLDGMPKGDLGNPDRTTWADRTRELLNGSGKDRNLVLWSWCGQVSKSSEGDIDGYLERMESLEREFPSVTFVYMTGHLDGSGKDGNLNKRNEQIRKFCQERKKVLFDFADIESYAPGSGTNLMERGANDACAYDGRKRNWAEEWLAENPGNKYALPAKAAHSQPLNGAMKGVAFWWMLARLSGWDGK